LCLWIQKIHADSFNGDPANVDREITPGDCLERDWVHVSGAYVSGVLCKVEDDLRREETRATTEELFNSNTSGTFSEGKELNEVGCIC